eukprot:11691719-Heterocapsa_arctica.AAC.1
MLLASRNSWKVVKGGALAKSSSTGMRKPAVHSAGNRLRTAASRLYCGQRSGTSPFPGCPALDCATR